MLKSHYGEYGTRLIELGRGLQWKLCATGTPAPNDRIEFANHAVFLDRARTVNEFLATYFINRGETQNRWELKPHALKPFYRSLANWSIFLSNPATYGWRDNVGTMPLIHVHIEHVELTTAQRTASQKLTGSLMVNSVGGIGQRGKLSQIAKGKGNIESLKPQFIRDLVDSWPDESTIIWCHYNDEQEGMERVFPEAVSISGSTPENKRQEMIDDFKAGRAKVLISKPKILGFGLNLQICTRQVFSGLKDSYEEYYQAVKRSNRIGSTRPLHVHIPVTELEVPFVDNVLRKASRVEADTQEQEHLFRGVEQ
jgi:SNF2 family DNA or RNA helicase